MLALRRAENEEETAPHRLTRIQAKVSLHAVRGEKTRAELSHPHDVPANQIIDWQHLLLAGAANVFGAERHDSVIDVKPLHAKIGQQAREIDFLAGALDKAGRCSAKQSDDRPRTGAFGNTPGRTHRPATPQRQLPVSVGCCGA